MSYKIKLEKGAELDIDEALFYYKTKVSVRIARNFKKEVKDTLRHIKMNPFYRFYHKDFRGIPLKKYPYIIFYKVNENKKEILVHSVFQTDQNPNKIIKQNP